MGLTNSEVRRIKHELGYGLLSVQAEPYISYVSLFESIVQPFLTAGASTTSSTTVVAADAHPVTILCESTTGMEAGDRVVIDVDSRQESATIQSLEGSTITVLLSLAHDGTYPVEIEGGCSIVRALLRKLQAISGLGASASSDEISKALSTAGIRRVDEVEFFGNSIGAANGKSRLDLVKALRDYWRDELASALGVVRLNGGLGGATVGMY